MIDFQVMFNKRFLVRLRKLWAVIQSNGKTLIVVFLVSASLFFMNYYTIKVQSGIRAYVNGESYYSKGQKDAARHLVMYINSQDPHHWEKYKEHIKIPICDGAARRHLQAGENEQAKIAFLEGKNHQDDLDVLVWLFVNFENLSFMKEPIRLWTEGDSIISVQDSLAHQIHNYITSDAQDKAYGANLIEQVHKNSEIITEKEEQFLASLGDTARQVSNLILIVNTIFTIIIIWGAGAFAMLIINRLIKSEDKLVQKNNELKSINAELDRFVYSASHDLRAPITSLKGLIKIARGENGKQDVEHYFGLMDRSLEKQDNFIQKIISFSRNKRLELKIEELDLGQLVNDVFEQLQFMQQAKNVRLINNVSGLKIHIDPFRLEVVLANLFSNAIKFIDPRKPEQVIEVSAVEKDGFMEISVRDNGLGIPKSHVDKIFDMFYMTTYNSEGSGVGLYIVKETVSKMGGSISVASQIDEGTTFVIRLPVNKFATS